MQKTSLKVLSFFVLLVLSFIVVYLKSVNLGLDLKGGVSILLQPDLNYALSLEYEKLARDVESKLKNENAKLLDVYFQKDGIKVETLEDEKKVIKVINENFPRLDVKKLGDGTLLLTLSSTEMESLKSNVLSQTIEILRKRIDELGVIQPVITKAGRDRILVELPGMMDLNRAKSVIGRTAVLELKLVVEEGPKNLLESQLTKEAELLPSVDGKSWFLVERIPVITGSDLKTAYTSQDDFGQPSVTFELNNEASRVFGETTQNNIGRRLAIVLDKVVFSAPVIKSKITDRGQITGNFTLDEAKELALVLRSGSLPTKVEFLQESIVGPSLGKDAIDQGIKAGILGFIFLCAVLLARYKAVGVGAIVSVLLNALMLWAGLALLGGTLTLPGIAGIILNMGIAVDSNVLIFERVKEELRYGNTTRKAIELGYKRALSAIWDTHITLLVAALILFQFGSGPVKGFATTLTIGTVASFVSNAYYAKVFLEIQNKIKALRF